AAPPVQRAAPARPGQGDAGLFVRIDSARGGSLCPGERTQLWFEADKDLEVRVLDVYGDGDALLTFPNEDVPNGRVGAHKVVPLTGEKGFEAVPVPGHDTEQFVVVAATTAAALGPLATVKGECRIPKARVRDLLDKKGLGPGVLFGTTSYRISGSGCAGGPE